jgi:hypothetical protein
MAVRRPAQSAYNRVQSSCESRINTAVSRLASGKLTPEAWSEKMTDILSAKHAAAATLGRQRAGDLTPANDDDDALGAALADEEGRYLARFQRDIEDGRYTLPDGSYDDTAIRTRARYYAAKLLATANEAFVQASDSIASFDWHTGIVAEEHCNDCPALRDGGPYTPATIPTYPRSGATECLFRCQCSLVRDDGETGFLAPDSGY